jgi:hypothetical protein
MCNCGKKRDQLTQQTNTSRQVNVVHQSQPQQQTFVQTKAPVLFEYTGKTALSIIGSVTRKSYRFHFPGDKQYIDPNDAALMMAIPMLKRII